MLETEGFQLVRQVVPQPELEPLRTEADRLALTYPDEVQGIRDLLQRSALFRELTFRPWLAALVPEGAVCVRGILFDKLPGANWLVAWHQDLTICVKREIDTPGYGPWSVKHGVPHVQPPVSLLNQMTTIRLHLDPTDASNGALKVLAGSHLHGRLDADAIAGWRERTAEVTCEAEPGDALLMKPLLLHASSKAESPSHRRVIHLEFAPPGALAEGLSWYESAL